MVQCKTILLVIGVILLLLFGIPIRIDPPPVAQNETSILFDNYVDEYNKSYRSNETLRWQKFKAFQNALEEIENLNSQRKYNTSAVFGVTKFSDMSKDEFLRKYLQSDMYTRIKNNSINFKQKQHSKEETNSHENIIKRSLNSLPLKVDWRSKKAVSKVNNQKNCGACWAFSAVETIESMRAIQHGDLVKLSTQEMLDCARYNNAGCRGGDICSLLHWLLDNNTPIRSEQDYPLQLKTEHCRLTGSDTGIHVSSFSCDSFLDNEELLLQQLALHGPVAVAVNAALWQNYLGGVLQFHCSGSPVLLNHAVQLVGYDLAADVPHYIARNSWGADFGDSGYLYLAVGSNVCGLAHEVISLNVL